MGVVETALLRTAASVVSKAGLLWLGRRRKQRERESSLVDLIGTGVTDDVGLRRAGRAREEIVDTVLERLRPLVSRRDGGLPDNEIAAALNAVADTLDAADLSDAALFADDVDPALIAARLRRELPDAPARTGLHEIPAIRLYERVLDDCCVCLTQLVIQLGPFQARAAVRMLQRFTGVAADLREVLARIPVTTLDAPAGDRHDDEFRTRYLSHVLDRLDVLELFGVNVHRYRLRTPLSIAYISLAVTGSRSGRRGARWDPGRFRHDSAGGSASVRAEEALGNAERILLRGDAGSGKTTLLQWIAVTAARHGFTGDLESWNGRTPFLIRLRDHVKQPLPAPDQFLDKLAPIIAGGMPPRWVHRCLRAGAILLVDGVDEVPETQRRNVREWLHSLLHEYPDLRLVVTSRPAAASARWLNDEGFASIFLERMSPADIKALIRHWHDAVRPAGDLPCEAHRLPAYEQRLLAQLGGSAHLQNLAASPLLCAMLCALNLDRDSNLPRNRMDIYQAAVDMLLHKRDDKRGVHSELPQLTSNDQALLLRDIAWWLTENGRTELSRAEAAKRVEERLAGIRHVTAPAALVLDHMIQRSGVLREPIPDRIDFVHRTFLEYLAALEAADQGRAGVLCEHAHLDTWRETIILAAGHAHTLVRNELLAGLLKVAERQPQHARKVRLLAAACLETASEVEPVILARIRAHLRGLMPRSVAEARSFAGVGEPLLDELPGDLSALSEAQAAAAVLTAALVNGPAAIDTLARYAVDSRSRVQRQLISAWEYFDPMDYADRVLADAALDNGRVRIHNTSFIPALPRLRHLTATELMGGTEEVDLALLAEVPQLQIANLFGGFVGNIGRLRKHAELAYLTVSFGGKHCRLSVLAELPKLWGINLYGLAHAQDLSFLSRMSLKRLGLGSIAISERLVNSIPKIEGLSLRTSSTWSPETIGTLTKLTDFSVHSEVEPDGGSRRLIDVLSGMSHLQSLSFQSPDWLTELSDIGKLERLSTLSLDNAPIRDLGPLSELSQLEWLSFGNDQYVPDLAPLGRLGNLSTLWIAGPAPGLDLAPLRGKRMTVHLPRTVRLADAGDLAGVRVKRY
ncbi:NACHT domain-containing protein [Actinoplanes sp. NPDC049265]|uniref:NACHT domain-containing protein n=1 Tax=Actinoplanes sp. NPDC049265 TaxID=3363902 RepID=UPI0037195216